MKHAVRFKALAAALVMLLGITFTAATPASAAPIDDVLASISAATIEPTSVNKTPDAVGQALRVTYGCTNGNNTRICVYTGDDPFEGSEYYWTAANYYLTCVNIGGSFNNNVRSVFAYTNYYRARFYTTKDCGGTQVTYVSGPGGYPFSNCQNDYGNAPWNTGVSPCTGPNISSFFVT